MSALEADQKIMMNTINSIHADVKDLKNGQSNTKALIVGSGLAIFGTIAALILGLFTYGKDMFELALSLTQTK